MFTRIEDERDKYEILSWNLQVCNLEEVFLKVASEEHEEALANEEGDTSNDEKSVNEKNNDDMKEGNHE